MKKGLILFFILFLSLTFLAAKHNRKPATLNNDHLKTLKPDKGEAILDYFDPDSYSFWSWGGDFYMSNLFKPQPTWYPFQVNKLYVLPQRLDSQTTTGVAGIINCVRVFLPGAKGGAYFEAQETNIPGLVGTWNTITLSYPVNILTGNFYAGMWNSSTSPVGDGLWQGTAFNWTPPPVEPYVLIVNTFYTTSAVTSGWTTSTPGYATTSAAGIAALCSGDTVPVELMTFFAE